MSWRGSKAGGTVERGGSESATPPTPAKTEITTEWRWYFDDLPEKDIVTLCEEHIVKLSVNPDLLLR